MDTKPLERFATWARRELLTVVDAQASAVLASGSVARSERPEVVKRLETEIERHGREYVIDKVAYTWFNRIIALRFMDARGYTDAGIVSPAQGQDHGQPEILADAKHGHLEPDVIISNLTSEAIFGLLDGSRQSTDAEGEAYALLLTEYCRYWHKSMPFMFEREGDYTELLVPANLLADGAILSRARDVLTVAVCEDVEVIGWLYQFYIFERKQEVFDGFKAKGKARKLAGPNEIPAATQLFTPHWIVRYLVENSVGRLWMLNHPDSRLIEKMDFYVPPVDDETDFLKISKPEELTVIDPACGSGHMLTYAFDLLYSIYEEEGYAPSEIPGLILVNNVHGTEIDPRAGALAAFALVMKARSKQRTFAKTGIEPKIHIISPISFRTDEIEMLTGEPGNANLDDAFWYQFEDADTLGSLIQPDAGQTIAVATVLGQTHAGNDLIYSGAVDRARSLVQMAETLSDRYAAVIANPPYMGAGNMGSKLAALTAELFPHAKQDLYACFVERSRRLTLANGFIGIVTGDNWMNIKSFEDFRSDLVSHSSLESLLHIHDANGHPDIFGANSAFVLHNSVDASHHATYIRLDALGVNPKEEQLRAALSGESKERVYFVSSEQLLQVPRTPIAYWMTDAERATFRSSKAISTVANGGNGLTTGDNDRFFRFWWEVSTQRLAVAGDLNTSGGKKRWFPLNKGGAYRRWAGNQEYVIDWSDGGASIKSLKPKSTVRNEKNYFKPSVSWSDITAGDSSFRYYGEGYVFDASANAYFPEGGSAWALLSALNSTFIRRMLKQLSPGLHYKLGDVGVLPFLQREDHGWEDEIRELVSIAQADWDSSEISMGFINLALLGAEAHTGRIEDLLNELSKSQAEIVSRVKLLEDKNDFEIAHRHGLDISYSSGDGVSRIPLLNNPWFGLDDGLPLEELKSRQALKYAMDLVSYAVGCMFGRFSIDMPGRILGSQGDTVQKYLREVPMPRIQPDADNAIPFLEDGWFEDDIVDWFRKFLRISFGEGHLEDNLRYIEESLGVTSIRDYFITKNGKSKFYDDHVRRYKKRPIYWMFSSPKGSFNVLIYMHRYTPSTASRVLNEYLREYRAKLEVALTDAEEAAAGGSAKDQKEADRLRKVLVELAEYEHDVLYPLATAQLAIDLDDGVLVNYLRFGRALKDIGLEKDRRKVEGWAWPRYPLEAAE